MSTTKFPAVKLFSQFTNATSLFISMCAASSRRYDPQRENTVVSQTRIRYQGLAQQNNQGILKDLNDLFQISNPNKRTLLQFALLLSHASDIELGREEKRRRRFLLDWFCKHYAIFQRYIPNIVFIDMKGNTKGPWRESWKRFLAQNPDAGVVQWLDGRL
jgi:hypothetical protein